MPEAIAEIADGDSVALGGMTLYRKPVAAAAEIIRQGRSGLVLYTFTGAFEGDILIGSGCVGELHACYFGLDIFGLAPMFRRATEEGSIKVVDETEKTMMLGLRAARAGVDFFPARTMDGTDFRQLRPDLADVRSPYSDRDYVAMPAVELDVAVIHAWAADSRGNAVLRGQYALDADFAAVARTTIVTAEHVVSTAEIESHGADLIGGWVDHVVEAPLGSAPCSCFPDYPIDIARIADYVDECRAGRFDQFMSDHVL